MVARKATKDPIQIRLKHAPVFDKGITSFTLTPLVLGSGASTHYAVGRLLGVCVCWMLEERDGVLQGILHAKEGFKYLTL